MRAPVAAILAAHVCDQRVLALCDANASRSASKILPHDPALYNREGTLPTAIQRRTLLTKYASSVCVAGIGTLLQSPSEAAAAVAPDGDSAAITNKPSAPLENLLPAARVKLIIDRSVEIAEILAKLQDNKDMDVAAARAKRHYISTLESKLLKTDQFFMTPNEVAASKRYLEIKTLDDWTKKRQKETAAMFGRTDVDPLTRANEAFEQWGERQSFRRLRRQQQRMEDDDGMRAAFNSYTNNLVFGESYTVTADREERSRLIRAYDQLPDVTSVVRSDLDLRDLYRNQVLTKMDDARAELRYQLTRKEDELNVTELLALLRDAQRSCNDWFSFVPKQDVKEAMGELRGGQRGSSWIDT